MNERCRFCDKQFKTKAARTGHEFLCKENPNYEENVKIHNSNEIKEYTLTCQKCGKFYKIKIKEKEFLKGRYPKCCSSYCAHSREHTLETIKKIKNSVSEKIERTCCICGKSVLYNKMAKRVVCDECLDNQSKVRRGIHSTELHETKCFKCGAKLFTKFPGRVFCFSCRKDMNVEGHRLYSEDGKKLFSDETRDKIKAAMKNLVDRGSFKGWSSDSRKSFPEEYWRNILTERGIPFSHNFYIPKLSLGFKSPGAYCLDFKLDGNIDLEIDGKQHEYTERKQHDIERDTILKNNGWTVYRVPWNDITTKEGREEMNKKVEDFLTWYKSKNKL